ncbi:hypothetical protein [Nocardia lijiangensis]|uniref:hypothetical protein n=1 Tax=Nocardia lijiangensis TaxID=299618 RepID=UPI003D70D7CB
MQFNDILGIESMLRGCVVFKFECSEDSEMYAGSPQFGDALNALLDSIIAYYRDLGRHDTADKWEATYLLSPTSNKADFVRSYVVKHPKWRAMNMQERKEWVNIVAAPYRIRDSEFSQFLD